ncbi:MAG: mechanosensitive ion channel family protein, partial [Planctomycetes bacterium]|nr:mechanosensitive ion channel family protein [Planctomycetota bacterium]
GWLVSFLLRLILRRPRKALGHRSEDQPNYSIPRRLGRAALRLFVDLVPPAGAAAVVFGLSTALPFTHTGGVVALAAVGAYALERSVRALLLVLLSPNSPEIRLVPLDGEHAARMLRTLDRTAILAVWGYFGLDVVRSLGASRELSDPLRDLYALLLFVAAVVTILRVRGRLVGAEPEALAQDSAPPESEDGAATGDVGEQADAEAAARGAARMHQRVLGMVGRLWWILALVYVAGLYLLWLSGIENGFLMAMRATGITALWVAGALVVLSLVNSLLKRLRDQLIDWTGSLPNFDRNVPRYIGLLRAAIYAVVWITVLGFAFDSWGLGTLDLLNSEGVRNLIAMALGVFLIVLLALAVIDASTALATTYLRRRQRESKDSAKIRTLVPLANKAIRVVVTVLAILMVMSQLGVSIGPILASVSFVGLAIGFGAQSLVKDIINGTFNLLEDNVSVGDIVSVAGTGGVVETINIRTIQLRDLSGNLHTFPWGQIETITNFTREFGRYLIECGVAYREDCDEVMDVLREIGAGMQKDRDWRDKILEPIEILGVDRFEDSAVIIRARLKTQPAAQWSVGREFNRRMKKVFDERGIEIPFPHQTIYMGEDKQGEAPPLRLARTPRAAEG